MVPERRAEIIGMGWRSVLAGLLAGCLMGALVGAFPLTGYGIQHGKGDWVLLSRHRSRFSSANGETADDKTNMIGHGVTLGR
jgi:hypothetical protein